MVQKWWHGGPFLDRHGRTFRPFCLCPIYQLVWHLPTSLTNQMEHKTDLLQNSKSEHLILCCLKNICFGQMWTQIEDSCSIWATQQTYQVLICVKTISRIIAKHSVRATRQVWLVDTLLSKVASSHSVGCCAKICNLTYPDGKTSLMGFVQTSDRRVLHSSIPILHLLNSFSPDKLCVCISHQLLPLFGGQAPCLSLLTLHTPVSVCWSKNLRFLSATFSSSS